MMIGQWILVANEEAVHIYTKENTDSKLNLIHKIINPLGKEKRGAMIRKQSGMGVKSLGHIGMARHSETKRSDPKEMASLQFAKTVSDILYKEKQKKGFASLIICAEPHFLGKLKSEMQSSVKKSVTQWIHKDLQKIPTNKLPKFFLPTKTSPISNEHLLRRRA